MWALLLSFHRLMRVVTKMVFSITLIFFQITLISTMGSDPDWSVNIKRGVLELLSVNLEGEQKSIKNSPPKKTKVQDEYYRVMEVKFVL